MFSVQQEKLRKKKGIKLDSPLLTRNLKKRQIKILDFFKILQKK